MRKVFLFNADITQYVTQIPPVIYTAGEFGQLVVNDLPQIVGDNRRGFWDVGAQQSPFYGAVTLNNFPIKITNDDVVVFDGRIQQIQADNKTRQATVILKSNIQSLLEKGIVYASASEDTPANIVKEICDQYKIAIDSATFGASHSFYATDNVFLSALFKGETDIQGALQTIAEYSCARIYVINGRLHFEAYQQRTTNPIYTFTDDHNSQQGVQILSHPVTSIVEKQPIEGYRIECAGPEGSNVAIRGNEKQQGKTISAGADSPVRIVNINSAVFIGEMWYEYLNQKQIIHTIGIPDTHGKSLAIGYPIAYDYRGRGALIIDITSIDNSSKVICTITGVTR